MLTDGADHVAEGTQLILTLVTVDCVLDADHMVTTGIVMGMIRAEAFLTDSTSRATGGAKPSLALRAWFHRQRPALTTGTFDQTRMAIRLAINCLIKAGAN